MTKIKQTIVISLLLVGCLAAVKPAQALTYQELLDYFHQPQVLGASTTGLVGYWNFDEGSGNVAHDTSGNGNDGTITGATWTTGKVGSGALSFDGNGDVVVANSATSALRGKSAFTISLWASATSYPQDKSALGISTNGTGTTGFNIYPFDAFQGNGIRLRFNGLNMINNNSENLADGNFHHFVYVSRSATDHEVFVDNVSAGTSSEPETLDSSLNQFNIGAWNNSATQSFSGKIDEVRVYDRALSAQEIADIYNDTGSGGGTPSSPADATPPTVPTNLTAIAVSSSQINLSWIASTDNVEVTAYKIYRNGVQVGTSATANYNDSGLLPSTSYSYIVSAFDEAGNGSDQSTSISANTLALAPPPSGSRFYIAANGNDANDGLTKATPWAHLPGMRTCTDNCASYMPQAGNSFFLKGCDMWPNASFPIFWKWAGTSALPIYIGVDKTWYNASVCPSGWSRPIFDAQKQTIFGAYNDDKFNSMLVVNPWNISTSRYVTFDNVEMKGLHCDESASANYTCDTAADVWPSVVYCRNGCKNWNLTNLYIHGWDIAVDAKCRLLVGPSGGADSLSSSIENVIADGSDSTSILTNGKGTCAFNAYGPPTIIGNVMHDMSNGLLPDSAVPQEIANNLIYNIKQTNNPNPDVVHENAIHVNDTHGSTYYIHDNVIYDIYGMTLYGVESQDTEYYWNNIVGLTNPTGGSEPTFPAHNNQSNISLYFLNNTIVGRSDIFCVSNSSYESGSQWSNVVIQNNHCVSTASYPIAASNTWNMKAGAPAPIIDHNLLMSPAQAVSEGYSYSQAYKFSPSASPNGTIGYGTNLSSLCSGALAGLCSDTGYACTYSQTAQTVTCPARIAASRPSIGTWNAGAYEFVPDTTPPAPPTGMAVN
jgi:hypothetical protein